MNTTEITTARNAIDAGLRPVLFTFDDPADGWIGFTDGTHWNGFLNVRVFPRTRDKIDKHFRDHGLLAEDDDFDIPIDHDGLVNLSNGFVTSEAEWGHDAHVNTENALGDEVGHPEACGYTLKATTTEILEHLLTRHPWCDGFTSQPACRACGWAEAGLIDDPTCPSCQTPFDWV